MVFKLIDVAKENEENERVRAYWNTYHCRNRLAKNNIVFS